MSRKTLIWIFLGGVVILLLIGFFSKTSIDNLVSSMMKKDITPEIKITAEEYIKTNFNYAKTRKDFDFTLLEFGSGNCVPCKELEPVLEEIRVSEKIKANVVFMNTMHPENLALMKYFAISAQPMIILLDKNGSEFFRHYGFIKADVLINRMMENNVK